MRVNHFVWNIKSFYLRIDVVQLLALIGIIEHNFYIKQKEKNSVFNYVIFFFGIENTKKENNINSIENWLLIRTVIKNNYSSILNNDRYVDTSKAIFKSSHSINKWIKSSLKWPTKLTIETFFDRFRLLWWFSHWPSHCDGELQSLLKKREKKSK